MKALIFLAALGLAGCTTTSTADFVSVVNTLKQACDIKVTVQAQAGVMNPGTGGTFQASADCPVAAQPPATNTLQH